MKAPGRPARRKIPLEQIDFAVQSLDMNPNWAAENLQTIRTLMERSAVYRRALAPIMFFSGAMGLVGAVAGWLFKLESSSAFVLLWLGVAAVATLGALLLVRRQALKDSEPFWSPPTRRVGQALLPAYFVGFTVAVLALIVANQSSGHDGGLQIMLVVLWTWLYGCATHAAGFFMPRGVRWLGWIYVVAGTVLLVGMVFWERILMHFPPHVFMGGIFGGLHLAYGIYLYFTEPKTPVA